MAREDLSSVNLLDLHTHCHQALESLHGGRRGISHKFCEQASTTLQDRRGLDLVSADCGKGGAHFTTSILQWNMFCIAASSFVSGAVIACW